MYWKNIEQTADYPMPVTPIFMTSDLTQCMSMMVTASTRVQMVMLYWQKKNGAKRIGATTTRHATTKAIKMKVVLNTTLLLILVSLCPDFTSVAGNLQQTAQGALYQDLKTGTGEMADVGDTATIHFTGWLDSNGVKGKEVYNTRRESQSVSFVVGTDRVMPGWNEGVIGMQTGGKRLLKLPSSLAYGAKGVQGIIAPNARLIFVIDLIQLEKKPLH